MTWTYLGIPGTGTAQQRLDAVRLLIQDTVRSAPSFQDEELTFFLAANGSNIYRAAADACEQLAAGGADTKSVGDLSISNAATGWLDLARHYRSRADSVALPYAGGLRLSDKATYEADTDRVEPAFTRMLHDDEEANG